MDPAASAPPALSAVRFPFDKAIREHFTVTMDVDADEDGKPDAIAFDVIRPDTTEKVPVIAEESPYYGGIGRGAEGEDVVIDGKGILQSMPLWYDNYFVPRGYAVVAIDAPGTGRSQGCGDAYSGPRTLAATQLVLAFLGGRGTAQDSAGKTVRATWSSGSVGMVGKSADGTFPLAAAAAGDPSLKAVVSIAGVPDLFALQNGFGQAGPTDFSGTGNFNGTQHPRQTCTSSDKKLTDDANASGDDPKGNFWADRRAVPTAGKWKAATLLASGQRDTAVPAAQGAALWAGLVKAGVPRGWWLHQGGHDDPFDIDREAWVDTVHRWFDRYLLGHTNIAVQGGIRVQRSDLSWQQLSSFGEANAATAHWTVGATLDQSGGEPTAIKPLGTAEGYQSVTGEYIEDPFYRDLSTPIPGRVVSLTAPLTTAMTISGSPTVRVNVRAEGGNAPVSVGLAVVGEAARPVPAQMGIDQFAVATTGQDCWGEKRQVTLDTGKTMVDQACYPKRSLKLAKSPGALLARGGMFPVPDAGESGWATVDITLGPVYQQIPAGHRLAVVIAQNDPISWSFQGVSLTIGTSSLTLSTG